MSEKRLTDEARWLIVKFIALIVAGSWAIVIGVGIAFYNAALDQVTIRVDSAVRTELTKYEANVKRIESLTDQAITARVGAETAANSVKSTLDQSLASMTQIDKEFTKIGAQVPKAKATLDFLDSATEGFDALTAKVSNSPELHTAVSARISNLPIGSIISSLLTPDQLKLATAANPDAWLPADGRSAKGSQYATITKTNDVPDLRGIFLRGLNYSDTGNMRPDGKGDPDGDGRKPGSYQGDAVGPHDHPINSSASSHHSAGSSQGPRTAVASNAKTGKSVGKETRPRNVAVYYYIKVN